MFGGGGSNSSDHKAESDTSANLMTSTTTAPDVTPSPRLNGREKGPTGSSLTELSPLISPPTPSRTTDVSGSVGEKRSSGNGSPKSNSFADMKKRRSSGVSGRASSLIAQAKNSLFTQVTNRLNNNNGSNSNNNNSDGSSGSGSKESNQSPLEELGKQDQSLAVPQGRHNNAAGESVPGPRSTFRVGVWEDRNKRCRRTMEDTHAFLYNFLHTPAPVPDDGEDSASGGQQSPHLAENAGQGPAHSLAGQDVLETDNGYFAIFDGHAGTFAADWCGKKLHIILEEIIRKNPNQPIPELLDQTFTTADAQLGKLPVKNSGCTAAIAVLRWEDRVPSHQSATRSQAIAPALAQATEDAAAAVGGSDEKKKADKDGKPPSASPEATHAKLKTVASRQRVLYTANVGDARIVLCRQGKALRLSYDHKGSDENEGRRIANAGGLIVNNRVNGVLAVTRALGDSYMKELVTGRPYTTETVIQPEMDEFLIIACDGIWDVCSDQDAVNLVADIQDPIAAAKLLIDHALSRFSTDNLSCMVIRFDKEAFMRNQYDKDQAIGVEGDEADGGQGKVSEVEKIVSTTKAKIAEGGVPAIGVSASNSGRGHDRPVRGEDEAGMPSPVTKETAGGGGGGSSISGKAGS